MARKISTAFLREVRAVLDSKHGYHRRLSPQERNMDAVAAIMGAEKIADQIAAERAALTAGWETRLKCLSA